MVDAPAPTETDASPRPLFAAILRPNRSLSKVGFIVVMGLLGAVSFTAGILWVINGAWPVMGFLGLDVLLVYVAFRLSYRSGRMCEILRLTDGELSVRRVSPRGQVQTWLFQPFWVRLALEDRPGLASRLTLSSHGRSIEIGAFLSEGERLELGDALSDALRRQRTAPA